jgi:phosphoribosylaminoimidazolecarboxamide formyltransferase / IMP cyclohydrolase
MKMVTRIKRALISVSNKTGVIDFAKELAAMGIEILSTGGTAKVLRNAEIPVKEVAEHTGSPEMLDGRVKTLHPKIHGGLLSRRDNPKDMAEVKQYDIGLIDMVVCNLYPFEETISKPGVTFEDAIENIDIGGPTMIRSAMKNFKDVLVIVDPRDYGMVLRDLIDTGDVEYKTRMLLAMKVVALTSRYDGLIQKYLTEQLKKLGA